MSSHERTSQPYLSKIYFDDEKLLEFALAEFEKCHRSGRLTAFVGSMATVGLGYPNWVGLISKAPDAVRLVAGEEIANGFEEKLWKDLGPRVDKSIDGRVAASIIGYWLDHAGASRGSGVKLNEEVARLISSSNIAFASPDEQKILINLLEDLKITRFVTTNYDAEIEFAIREKFEDEVSKRYLLLKEWADEAARDGQGDGAHLRLTLDDGNVLASDAFSRDRLDRLIEFSVGAADVDFHVLHLHGRVDRPETMVISYRDYDRLYRKAGASKLPFDQALTMLHSTNPVLFVGLGMREPELNRALEELVGNQPFRGLGRRFLIWSPLTDRGEMSDKDRWAFRVEKLHKLGVLTIFDDEVRGILPPGNSGSRRRPGKLDGRRRHNLALALTDLSRFAQQERRKRLDWIDEDAWRKVSFQKTRVDEPIVHTWHFKRTLSSDDVFKCEGTDSHIKKAGEHNLVVQTSRPGTGKGAAAAALALAWSYRLNDQGIVERRGKRQVLFINASLRLDTDSILELLFQFLCKQSGCPIQRTDIRKGRVNGEAIAEKDEPRSREFGFRRKPEIFTYKSLSDPPLIIFKGLERLFSKSGLPLSAEIDGFFRNYLRAAIERHKPKAPGKPTASEAGNVTAEKNAELLKPLCPIIVFGTRRVRVYFRRLEKQVFTELGNESQAKEVIWVNHSFDEPGGYLIKLRESHEVEFDGKADEESGESGKDQTPRRIPSLAGERSFARETYRDVFRSEKFRLALPPGEPQEKIGLAILTVMAFIGQPVEAEVLFHAPRVIEALKFRNSADSKSSAPLPRLSDEEMRERFDVGMAALRADAGDVPLIFEISPPTLESIVSAKSPYHMPRFAMHMSLQAEIRERYGVPLSEAALSTSFNMSLYSAQPADAAISEPEVHDELAKLINRFTGAHNDDLTYRPHVIESGDEDPREMRRSLPHVAAALRAALAIARGFYSTSALLSLDIGDRTLDDQRDGALTEHGERIERIIKAFTKMAASRAKVSRGFGDDKEAASKALGPGPIYTDELVWLHNERGVVKLTQGDLYEARFSFNQAEQINLRHVEFKCRSHNWRRIWLNQLVVDIERGKLAEAEDRIGRIESSYGLQGHVERIRKRLGNAKPGIAPRLPIDISHEDCLAASLATGYRGLVANLRGEMHTAEGLYELAIKMLENLDEQRACALFRRHYASLLQITKDGESCTRMAKLAIAGAESVQQMDIVYGARLIRYQEYARSNNAEHRKRAMLNFTKALEFATLTDVHRVGIEARRNLAMLKLDNGDLESALEHASVAMALAGRYGMTLFKVSLRIVLGRILHERGAVDAADALIRNAIVQADRIGYQRAVEGAQGAMASIMKA